VCWSGYLPTDISNHVRFEGRVLAAASRITEVIANLVSSMNLLIRRLDFRSWVRHGRYEMQEIEEPTRTRSFCQTRSAIAALCPACQWVILQQSLPMPKVSFEKKLTREDEQFLTEMQISF
jgi:hypothetical protein